MDQILIIIAKLPEILGLVSSILIPVIALCMLIPGEQPEKFLQSVVNLIAKFSKK